MGIDSILKKRIQALKDDLQTLDAAFDDSMVTETEYYTRKACMKARLDELNSIQSSCEDENLIDKTGESKILIGENGNLKLYLTDDFRIVLYTDGVKTVDMSNPTIMEVDKLKTILGMD